MCIFKSAVVTPNGNIYHLDGIDSHEDIIDYFELDDTKLGNLVRIEYRPIQGEEADLSSYRLYIDEAETPKWFTKGIRVQITKRMKAIISKYIVKEDMRILPLGFYILKDGITIEYANYAIIKYASSAIIKNAGYAIIEDAGSAKIEYAGSATIEYANSAIIEDAGHASIRHAEHAIIKNVNSATII